MSGAWLIGYMPSADAAAAADALHRMPWRHLK